MRERRGGERGGEGREGEREGGEGERERGAHVIFTVTW